MNPSLTPWYVRNISNANIPSDETHIYSQLGKICVLNNDLHKQDAEFIIKSVNNYYMLLHGCRMALHHLVGTEFCANRQEVKNFLKSLMEDLK